MTLKSTLQPLAVRSTVEAAADWLRGAIMRGDFKPGERLVEHKLAGALGIGQPTLREALKEVELQGFVRKTPKKGTRVTKLTQDEFRDILEVRLALESVAVERAATRLTPEAIAEMEVRVDKMEAAARRFTLEEFHQNDVEFHEILWAAAGNESLALALGRTVFGLFAFFVLQREPDAADEFLDAVGQHRAILDGLKTGDPAAARRALIDSTLSYWNAAHNLGAAYDCDASTAFAARTSTAPQAQST